ncbi:MAG: tRNA (adenosine(37)-N6)-threonylcarbamoyltransferase complex transferase subunit TsaD [Planctomycetota bacterium]
MLVLGIESSCDETAASVVRRDGTRPGVCSNVIASQAELHAEYAGVVPEIASRAHVERIVPVIRRALSEADVAAHDLDLIAIGNRPGLIGALLVGLAAAKAIAWSTSTPILGVDHIHAHLTAGLLDADHDHAEVFPALGLAASGGHTAIYRLESPTEIARLGGTIDDAVGEAFDKAATMLGLGYPGGPIIDQLATRGDPRAHDFPISRLDRGSLDLSFSGLKTALLYTVRGTPMPGPDGKPVFPRDHTSLLGEEIADIAASFQRAAVEALLLKLERAGAAHPDVRALLVGGGVSANSLLRERLAELANERAIELRLPAMAYCLDNAAMIAGHALHLWDAGVRDDLSLAGAPTGATA